MDFINKTELLGLTGTVRVNTVNDTKSVTFSMMTEEMRRLNDGTVICETTWHIVTAQAGEKIDKSIFSAQKSTTVHVTGRLRNSRFTGVSGEERTYTEIVADEITVLNI